MRVQSSEVEVAFGSYHKETRSLMDIIQTSEVEIAAIHDIYGTGFDDKTIEDSDIVNAYVFKQALDEGLIRILAEAGTVREW